MDHPPYRLDLSSLPWTMTGYRPESWRTALSMELGLSVLPDIPPLPITVPGSIQQALRAAGYLADWEFGTNSRAAEWVEHRHWILETTLPSAGYPPGTSIRLHADGLDGGGSVYLNDKHVGDFGNSFLPAEFDLSAAYGPGPNRLRLVFWHHPAWLGQTGYTSRMPITKPRFNYGWDWTPRLVQLGVSDRLWLAVVAGPALHAARAYTEFDAVRRTGACHVCCATTHAEGRAALLTLRDGTRTLAQQRTPAAAHMELMLQAHALEPWWPNGMGEAKTYTLDLSLRSPDDAELDSVSWPVGFRTIAWRPCQDAPADAEPWICQVNGMPVFLQGFNWTPIRPNFADVTHAQYVQRLELYRDLGANILRVWGGATLEREEFYRQCDRLGLLIWQEFPLSSSALDNWPAETPAAIAAMEQIAQSYIARRQHHPSLLLWCGGNELQGAADGSKQGIGRPISVTHPMMHAVAKVVRRFDPLRRFLPTSASGPMFMALAENFGKGLHHDVHGPWNHPGSLESWDQYWTADDALFRSETGMPGASPAALIHHYAGPLALPAAETNPYYLHTAAWWIQWQTYLETGGDPTDLERYVRWSQQRQAEFLARAARKCKERFPRCGGFIVWMGHDCFPCPINTSVIDFHGTPKPAALALREVFFDARKSDI